MIITLKSLFVTFVLLFLLAFVLPAHAETPIGWEQTGGPLGGMINVLVTSPHDPDTLLAGTPSSVYRSDDGGSHWTNISAGRFVCQEINALLVDPADGQTIYAGGSDGLFRSSDGGNSWVQLGSGLTRDHILTLVIHPSQPQILYAGVNGAVFYSADRGDHWAARVNGLPEGFVWSLAFHPSNPEILYAGTSNGVYTTIDGGARWYPANHGLPPRERVSAVVVDPRSPANLFAATAHGLFRSSGSGATWVLVNSVPGATSATAIACDPTTADLVYATFSNSGLWTSTDGGITWASLSVVDEGRLITSLAVRVGDSQQLYVGTSHGFYASRDGGQTWESSNLGLVSSDVRSIVDVAGEKGHLFAGTRLGIHETLDGGESWSSASAGLANTNITRIAIDPGDARQMYATTWEGEVYRSLDGGDSWRLVYAPLSQAPITGLIACREGKDSSATILYAATDGEGIYRSIDLGQNWEPLELAAIDAHVGAITIAGDEPRLYIGAGKQVYRVAITTAPRDTLMPELLTAQPLNGKVSSIIEGPQGNDRVYVSTDGGGIYQATAEGSEWTDLAQGALPLNIQVEQLVLIPARGKGAFLCALTTGGIFSSLDSGETWAMSNEDCLGQAYIRCLATDAELAEVIYAGTANGGIYRGRRIRTGLPSAIAYGFGVVGLVVAAVAVEWSRRNVAGRARTRRNEFFEQNWDEWDDLISETLDRYRRVTPQMLTTIPLQVRLLAMRRYVDFHRDQDLVFRNQPPMIELSKQLPLQRFTDNWNSLVERLDSPNAVPVATRLTEQLCDLLGFSPLENRTFKSLFGCMIKAPTVRLSIPARFPVIFLLRRSLGEETLRDVRDLMKVLNATSFFALLILVDDDPELKQEVKEMRRLIRNGAEDFIILNRHDLISLFMAVDAAHRLIDIILQQVDLTVVSPYVVSGPVSENMFFGRDYELKAIMRTVRDRSFAIVGGRKIGKTSVLTKVHRLMEQTSGFTPFYLDCQHVMNYEEFFGALAIKFQLQIESTSPDVLRRAVIRLRRRYGGSSIVLLLDEVDALLAYDLQHQTGLFRVFRALSQEGPCRFVFCGERRLHGALHDPDSPLFNFCNIMRLSYLLPSDARRIIQEPMAEMGVQFEDSQDLPEAIVELSSCHPNLIQALCQMLIVRVNARGERVIRSEDLAGVRTSDEFRDFFFEVTWGNTGTLGRLVTVLMVDAADFSPVEVQEALQKHGCNVANATVGATLNELVLFSILHKQGNRYSFAPQSFSKIMNESGYREGFLEGFLESVKTGGEFGPRYV